MYTINDIKSRNIIFDSKSNTYKTQGVLNLNTNEAFNLPSIHDESNANNESNLTLKNSGDIPVKISKRKNSNTTSNGSANNSKAKKLLKEHAEKAYEQIDKAGKIHSESIEKSAAAAAAEKVEDKNKLFSELEKDEKINILKSKDTINKESETENNPNNQIQNTTASSLNNNKENAERNNLLVSMLKSIVTIDILMALKILKNEIKEYFEKYQINVFNSNEFEFNFSAINVQEQNAKFSEFFKLGIFNDIYENILTKYFNEFYKSIFTDKEFLGSLEKILVHYFKINNKLQESKSKIIDFNDVIKTYAQKQ